jgi:putative endonuclease
LKRYYVYILASRSGVLYIGITNDLERRMYEHKNKLVPGFTSKYNVDRLVWCEEFSTALQAIEAEKRIKGWSRRKEVALIEEKNARWEDLAATQNLDVTASHPARDVSLRST